MIQAEWRINSTFSARLSRAHIRHTLDAGIIMRVSSLWIKKIVHNILDVCVVAIVQRILSFQSWCKYHHASDNFRKDYVMVFDLKRFQISNL